MQPTPTDSSSTKGRPERNRSTVFTQIFLCGASAVLAAGGAWRAYVDNLQDAASLQRVCGILACQPDQPARLADRLADTGPAQGRTALELSRLALANDPASPLRWCDLGDLYVALRPAADSRIAASYLDQARLCFRRAEDLAPANPVVLQRIANFHFQAEEPAEALTRTFRVLQRVREFDDIIFSGYLRFGVPQSMILAQGVPREPSPAQSYLRFVFARNDAMAGRAAWEWAASFPSSPASSVMTSALAVSYVGLLWRQHEFAAAAQAWAEYLGNQADGYPRSNHIFNGGFESDPVRENPLDWRIDQADGFEVARDTEARQQGQASMRITFQGTQNLDFRNFGQTQPVPPGAYRFRAMVATQAITTDQGVQLRIIDPEVPARLSVSTPAITGSNDWHAVELRIEVRAPTRLVRVEVARQPSLKFDNKIGGTMWVDAVSLTPLASLVVN